jgi:hypothetical protein
MELSNARQRLLERATLALGRLEAAIAANLKELGYGG